MNSEYYLNLSLTFKFSMNGGRNYNGPKVHAKFLARWVLARMKSLTIWILSQGMVSEIEKFVKIQIVDIKT